MATSLVCLLAACCWPSNDKDVADTIKQCMDDDDHTAHTAMRTLAAQAEDDETWSLIVMKVARKFGGQQTAGGRRTDATTQLLLLTDLLPLCDSRRALNTSADLLDFARDEADAAQMRNALVLWNAFAGKFDLRVGSRMLTDEVLAFLMDNADRRYTTDAEVCLQALLALERFSKTGPDNARRIAEAGYYERLEELLRCSHDPQLRLVCEWGLAHGAAAPSRPGQAAVVVAAGVAQQRKRKRKRNARKGTRESDSDDSERENPPGREKKPKNDDAPRHNAARRGNKSSRSRHRRQQQQEQQQALVADVDNDEFGDEEAGFFAMMDLESRHQPSGAAAATTSGSKQVRLNVADRTNFVKVARDGLEVRNDSSSFGSVRANCAITDRDDGEGHKWYFEVTLRTGGIMQIGWATRESVFKPEEGSGIGDDVFSYAYDGCRRQVWHAASSLPCGRAEPRWKAGDVVGCLYDARRGVMGFTLNGRFGRELGPRAFVNVRPGQAFYPALSLGAFQQCHLNFGAEPFAHKPEGYRSVNEFATLHDVALEEEGLVATAQNDGGRASGDHARMKSCGPGTDAAEELDDDALCKICYAQAADIKLHPCGHRDICFACSIRLVVCPVCRSPIDDREHLADAPPGGVKQNNNTKQFVEEDHQTTHAILIQL